MYRRLFSTLSVVTAGAATLGLSGCDGAPTQPPTDELRPAFAAHAAPTELNQGLAAVRAATAQFQRLEVALDAGYVPITPCVAEPSGEGAMGYHYGNPALIGDGGALDLTRPETLVYAPWYNGELRLVAVEWLILEDDWEEEHPPELLDRHFHFVEEAGVWGLHAWIWQQNPDGMFADFNPRMSCDTGG